MPAVPTGEPRPNDAPPDQSADSPEEPHRLRHQKTQRQTTCPTRRHHASKNQPERPTCATPTTNHQSLHPLQDHQQRPSVLQGRGSHAHRSNARTPPPAELRPQRQLHHQRHPPSAVCPQCDHPTHRSGVPFDGKCRPCDAPHGPPTGRPHDDPDQSAPPHAQTTGRTTPQTLAVPPLGPSDGPKQCPEPDGPQTAQRPPESPERPLQHVYVHHVARQYQTASTPERTPDGRFRRPPHATIDSTTRSRHQPRSSPHPTPGTTSSSHRSQRRPSPAPATHTSHRCVPTSDRDGTPHDATQSPRATTHRQHRLSRSGRQRHDPTGGPHPSASTAHSSPATHQPHPQPTQSSHSGTWPPDHQHPERSQTNDSPNGGSTPDQTNPPACLPSRSHQPPATTGPQQPDATPPHHAATTQPPTAEAHHQNCYQSPDCRTTGATAPESHGHGYATQCAY